MNCSARTRNAPLGMSLLEISLLATQFASILPVVYGRKRSVAAWVVLPSAPESLRGWKLLIRLTASQRVERMLY